MADYINKIRTTEGDKPVNYEALANKPNSLPNPNKIKFTGSVVAEYDGSSEVTVNIPNGASEEQAAQIQTNTNDISELKNKTSELKSDLSNSKKAIEDLNDKKITKFYTNSLGEKTLNDSDNGHIVDMKLYGRSLQDGTPTPDNPIEIQSVVNPVVKVCGKNLLDVSKATFQVGKAKLVDGEIYLNGTFDSNYDYYFFDTYNVALDLILKVNKTVTISCGSFNIGIRKESGSESGKSIKINPIADRLMSIFVIVPSGTYENVKVPIMVEIGDTVTEYEPYKEQSATLPYTLNAIPVSSGGNVTIDGQQYIADYVDVEKGVLVRRVSRKVIRNAIGYELIGSNNLFFWHTGNEQAFGNKGYCNYYIADGALENKHLRFDRTRIYVKDDSITSLSEFNSKYENGLEVAYILSTYTETDLTAEQIQAFKALATYYPTTNISVNSEQLDGYTVFNYPISMANGWNYVKKQLNDNRDYIYDMDIQSAEAYINSEYAVALTELEV